MEAISELYHVTADRTLYHSRERVKEAFGHVVVSAEGKRLVCDYLWLDDNTKEIKARGNVVFVDKQTTVEAAELHFNMITGFGSIFYGRVYNDLYSLRGQLIRKVGQYHYLTTEGEYTTCKDCPESWKLAARNVDLTVDGYAYMNGVFVTIKDVSTLYLPYLVIPVKTKRQTGLLFPRMGGSTAHGFVFVQPLFLAIDRHQDATLGFGRYSAQGLRYEAEYRYKSYNGINGQTNFFYTNDRIAGDQPIRSAVKSMNEWPFAPHFGMRWRYFDVRDRDYSYDFAEDLNVQGLPALESNALAQAPFNDFFASVEAKRYRNLLYDNQIGFDGGTVQAAPTVYMGVKERRLLGPVMGSFYGRYDNFTRANGPFTDLNGNRLFDPTFDSSLNPERLRETKRYIVSPELSMPFHLGPYFSLIPSAQYNQIHYAFNLPRPNLPMPGTSISYFHYKLEVNTTLERVYDYDGEKIAKVKHQLTPFINFSYIPNVFKDQSHPFQDQLKTADGLFDQNDVVPLTNSTSFLRFPEGKSIYYGFDSRLIRKKKRIEEMPRSYPYDLLPAVKPKKVFPAADGKEGNPANYPALWDEFNPRYDLYQEIWTFNASQAFDFIDARNNPNDSQRAFSYFLAKSSFNLDEQFSHNLEYRFYPRLVWRPDNATAGETLHNKERFTTNIVWYWKRLQNMRRTRTFERSMTLDYTNNSQPVPAKSMGATINWSFSDFVTLQLRGAYDLRVSDHPIKLLGHEIVGGQQMTWGSNLLLTHPSECWGLLFHYDWQRSRDKNGDLGFELLLNLTGNGFMGSKSMGSSGGPSAFGGI